MFFFLFFIADRRMYHRLM